MAAEKHVIGSTYVVGSGSFVAWAHCTALHTGRTYPAYLGGMGVLQSVVMSTSAGDTCHCMQCTADVLLEIYYDLRLSHSHA